MSMAKWDALVCSDDEDGKAKPKVVRKQAVLASVEDALLVAAEEAKLAAEEGDRLEQQFAELEQKMRSLGDVTAKDEETVNCDTASKMGDEQHAICEVASTAVAPSRRRRLDHTWEAEAERQFEATQAAQATQVSVQATGHASGQLATPSQLASSSSESATPLVGKTVEARENASIPLASSAPQAPSSLRRLKQLDVGTAGNIEQECGVALQSSDSFRLTMDNSNSSLKRQTRVLIVMAASTFLCEEPISEEVVARAADGDEARSVHSPSAASASMQKSLEGDDAHADGAYGEESCLELGERSPGDQEEDEAEYEDDFEEFDDEEDEDCVVAELCFFRAKPSRGRLARKLGAVPVLHMTLSTSDGLRENLEFIGIHQRLYCEEEPGIDAIAKNINSSLLRVALEFVFHPSRTRYTKERLVLRERSSCEEALQSREAMLLSMAEQVRKANPKIEQVSTEFLPPRVRLSGSSALKGRSFLILDEDVLKVAPARNLEHRPIKSSFKGLSQGFLNSSKAKARGLSSPTASLASSSSSSQQSPSKSPQGTCSAQPTPSKKPDDELEDGHPASSSASVQSSPPCRKLENGSHEETQPVDSFAGLLDRERRELLLGGAEVEMRVTSDVSEFAKRVIPGCGDLSISAQEAEEEEEEAPEEMVPSSISDLANQLFGSGELYLQNIDTEEPESLGDQTESTQTPKTKGNNNRGGGP
jgi:hypothetical protein